MVRAFSRFAEMSKSHDTASSGSAAAMSNAKPGVKSPIHAFAKYIMILKRKYNSETTSLLGPYVRIL